MTLTSSTPEEKMLVKKEIKSSKELTKETIS